MEIATYCSLEVHEGLLAALGRRGVEEPMGRIAEMSESERATVRVIFGWGIPQSVVDACPRLEWIQGAGAGVDWLMPVQLPPSVTVTRIVDQFGPDMGEYALMAALAWVKDWRKMYQMQQQKQWSHYLVGQLRRLTVGVLGAGSIGRHIAEMFRPLVTEVRAMGKSRPDIPGIQGFPHTLWRDFYTGLDLLVMVLPHTPDTYHLVGYDQLSLMNPGGYLVNVGRGAVLDETALIAAIRTGQLSGAALDVFETEPLPKESELWDLAGVTVSSHISGPSRREGMAEVFAENLARFRRGAPLLGVVDRERGY